MENILDLITLEVQNEHDLEHDLEHKKNFSNPKIYTANGDLSKRWYVYYSFRNPETGKLQRMKNIYGKANSFKTKEERLSALSLYRRRLLKFLKEGYNPYVNNTEFHKNKLAKQNKTQSDHNPKEETKPLVKNLVKETVPTTEPIPQEERMSLKEAFDFSLKIKQNQISQRSLQDYTYASEAFIKWLKTNHPEIKTIDQFTKKIALKFLNSILLKSSPRNRNNYRLNLSSLLQTMEDNEIISSNPMKKIPPLKSIPQKNKAYNFEELEKIFTHLEKEDPILLFFIKFFAYTCSRPIEVCRLKIKDFDLTNNTIRFKAKNSPLKTKIIPKILLDELPDLSKLNPEHYLFTPKKIGGTWEAAEKNRSNYFSKQFNTLIKKHFNLDENQTLYSFRHTIITKLYRGLIKESSPFAAKSALMQITGHSTMTALEKYLRNIDAALPNDYSNLLK